MTIQRTTPRPRWVYNTAHWPTEIVDELDHYASKWIGGYVHGGEIYIPAGSIRRGYLLWMDKILDDIPVKALEEILYAKVDLYIDLEYSEDDED